jgi:hypothetical protein
VLSCSVCVRGGAPVPFFLVPIWYHFWVEEMKVAGGVHPFSDLLCPCFVLFFQIRFRFCSLFLFFSRMLQPYESLVEGCGVFVRF